MSNMASHGRKVTVERKRVLVASAVLHAAAEPILEPEVSLVYPLPAAERVVTDDVGLQAAQRAKVDAAIPELLPTVHGLQLPFGGFPVTATMIASAPLLEVIVVPSSGYERVDVAAATEHGVAVVHAAGAAYIPVAEHVVGLALALLKWIAITDRHAHANGWQRSSRETINDMRGSPLAERGMPSVMWGKTIGIIGFGFIGRALSRICLDGLQMRVLAYDPYFDPVEAERLGVEFVPDIHALLAESDIVSVNAPLTPETAGMISAAELDVMKPTAILINCSRGGTVDQAALVRALQDGRIAGAGLDVTEPEPLPAGHPLLSMDNVVLTSHVGGAAWEFVPRMVQKSSRDGVRVLRGERPHHIVNPAVWPKLTARQASQGSK
jgi:D-3-phosphoglycerate dehydrogenase / 2-oxoglutarate reductase